MRLTLASALLISFVCLGRTEPPPSELAQLKAKETTLKFEELYPRRSFYGKQANVQGWSFDDRYLAYLWNDYKTRGTDLWIYDSKTGKSSQITNIQMMSAFDRKALLAIDFYKQEDKRLDDWEKLSDEQYRTERQKLKEQREKQTEPDPSYPGISEVVWANKSNKALINYRGDIFLWEADKPALQRLTNTRDNEFNPKFLPDDSGFFFRRGSDLYRMTWTSPAIVQLNPELPRGVSMQGYSISPNGQQLLVVGGKDTGQDRQVDYITYRDRFAQARKTERGVAEDDFKTEQTFYLFDITDKNLNRVDTDLKPYEIYKWPGGEEWQDISISANPWSPDGSTFVFSSWKRDKKELVIHEADLNRQSVRKVYIGTSNGEHRTPAMCQPFYTADGNSIICLLDKSGWRQVHQIERIYGAEKQITSGNFETYPLELSPMKDCIRVRSNKDSLARQGIYRVNLSTGSWTPLSKEQGRYTEATFAKKSDKFAAKFASWNQLVELRVNSGGEETTLTNSHRAEDFWKVIPQKPQLFSYKNRNGDDIQGYMFLPKNWTKDGKYPLMIYVYGGPLGEGKSVEDGTFNSSATLFNMYLTEVLGFVTVTIDPRGQSGYSAAFGKANWDQPGKNQCEDLVDGVDYLAKNYGVDRRYVAINGWSFGGFQTQYCMYNAPEVFTLGIAGAGPTQWQNYNTWYTGGVIGNSPKGDGNYLDQYSLTKVCQNLKSPLLLLHGIEDTNVLFQDTIAVYRKLLQAGKGDLVELSLDPTGGHGMGGDMDTHDRHLIYLSFILKHWGFLLDNR